MIYSKDGGHSSARIRWEPVFKLGHDGRRQDMASSSFVASTNDLGAFCAVSFLPRFFLADIGKKRTPVVVVDSEIA